MLFFIYSSYFLSDFIRDRIFYQCQNNYNSTNSRNYKSCNRDSRNNRLWLLSDSICNISCCCKCKTYNCAGNSNTCFIGKSFKAAIVPFTTLPESINTRSVISVIIIALNGIDAVANIDATPEQTNNTAMFPWKLRLKYHI